MPLPDQVLPGDTVLSLNLNYEWRRILIGAIDDYLVQAADDVPEPLKSELLDEIDVLIGSLYNPP